MTKIDLETAIQFGGTSLNPYAITGHKTIQDVEFDLPRVGTFFTVSAGAIAGNFLLRDYVAEEINLLSSRIVGYKQFESSPTTIGGTQYYS